MPFLHIYYVYLILLTITILWKGNMSTKFYREIIKANDEKELEKVYVNAIESNFQNTFVVHPYGCDGYIEQNVLYDEQLRVLRLIMEFKYGKNFNLANDRAVVLIQVIYYLKKFEGGLAVNYKELPNIILAGDKTTCFVIHVEQIKKYLNYDLNWEIAPSQAAQKNKDLICEISKNINIKTHVFDIKANFNFTEIVKEIKRLLINMNSKLKITERNIAEIYDYFIQKVIKNPQDYTAQELVYFFINVITDNIDTFIHSKRKDILFVRDEHNIRIDSWAYSYFIERYSIRYSPSEADKFNEVKDRLIEDTSRRYNGEFYTPTVWVNEAHREIEKVLGDGWKDQYVVWDCAWGTGNLTRDYYFESLFCSTLNKNDLKLGEYYNTNSIKFQYDFLNDGIEKSTVLFPKQIIQAVEKKKKLVFLINPPFAEASDRKVKNREKKEGASKTNIKELMERNGLKNCSQQLYAQFLYRILMYKEYFKDLEIDICMFSPLLYITGPRFDNFRKIFFENFTYKSGFMFNASYFSDVSNQWEVAFSVWKSGKNKSNENLPHIIKEMNKEGIIENIGVKQVYNVSKENRGSNWIKNNSVSKNKEIFTLRSALKYDENVVKRDSEAIAFFMNDSNNVYANTQGVYILSCPVRRHIKTTEITKENYKECFSLFAARRLVKSDWKNQKSEYMIPNIHDVRYEEWISDCIIYSIFENASMTTSLRNIRINDKIFNVENELFFMSNSEIRAMADNIKSFEIYNDCKIFSKERFIYSILNNYKLSNEGIRVLEKAKDIVRETLGFRDEFNKYYPEYHINSWDAGWYQIKKLVYINNKKMLNEFNSLFSNLEAKMLPKVYELGFLK